MRPGCRRHRSSGVLLLGLALLLAPLATGCRGPIGRSVGTATKAVAKGTGKVVVGAGKVVTWPVRKIAGNTNKKQQAAMAGAGTPDTGLAHSAQGGIETEPPIISSDADDAPSASTSSRSRSSSSSSSRTASRSKNDDAGDIDVKQADTRGNSAAWPDDDDVLKL